MGHLRANGFEVEIIDVEGQHLRDVKRSLGVTRELAACHTALVDGYIVEGHVPADLIATLLREKPDVLGLALPGMPVGSPGMQGPSSQPYEILAFNKDGNSWVYERR